MDRTFQHRSRLPSRKVFDADRLLHQQFLESAGLHAVQHEQDEAIDEDGAYIDPRASATGRLEESLGGQRRPGSDPARLAEA